ncbi:hypothetical protein [Variovorax sp. GB1P17]|uniref:hypothetical protein n=1 Tax=Variovorax sp. GB1P17 TaxID=3443740 RepID=UPI003F4666A5
MTQAQLGFLIVCLAVGVLGAVLGAWACSRSCRAQLDAQSAAFEAAREKANRDLQQALLCVPQRMNQTFRVELDFLKRRQAERWKELIGEQQRWQSEQDAVRLAEWRALLAGSPLQSRKAPAAVAPAERPAPAPARVPVPSPIPAPPSARPPELPETPRPQPVPVYAAEVPERELSDEEIDALPPDLPAPTRLSSRKLPAPKGPVLRNI